MTAHRLLERALWPALAIPSFALTAWGIARGWDGGLVITVVYLPLAAAVWALERVLPHEPSWNRSDGEEAHDIVFTLFGSGVTTFVLQVALTALLADVAIAASRAVGSPLWPGGWPTALQVAFAVCVADFGAYLSHRIFHEWKPLWPFHAIHHSVRRLWWLNAGRTHPLDVASTLLFSLTPLLLLGAPESMITWVAQFTSVIGVLSHCNVAMECGWLDRVFNTPGVHRWHHSTERRESDANYGEITMIFDQMLGTFFRPARRPPTLVGTLTPVAPSIAGQMIEPFVGSERWAALERRHSARSS
jgi:sterol desaturase/sphingolipid hydroxylase (fatty acid hydroxylase superfamily)